MPSTALQRLDFGAVRDKCAIYVHVISNSLSFGGISYQRALNRRGRHGSDSVRGAVAGHCRLSVPRQILAVLRKLLCRRLEQSRYCK